MDQLRAVLTPEGLRRLDELGPLATTDHTARAVSRLRTEGLDPDTVTALVSQAHLRARGAAKFGDLAAGMLFTRAGLEQSTRPVVAARHAADSATPASGASRTSAAASGATASASPGSGCRSSPSTPTR